MRFGGRNARLIRLHRTLNAVVCQDQETNLDMRLLVLYAHGTEVEIVLLICWVDNICTAGKT